MRSLLYGMRLALLLELLTGGLLILSVSSAHDVSSFCDKLLKRTHFGMWALGYAGESFYVLFDDSTGYEIDRSNVHIDQDDWIIPMSSAKLITLKGFRHPHHTIGLMGHHNGTSFALTRELYYVNGPDPLSVFTVMKLGRTKLEEIPQHVDPFGNGFEWDSYKSYFTGEKINTFIVQDANDGTVMEGTLNITDKGVLMHVNRNTKLGFINPKSVPLIGFMHNGTLYAISHSSNLPGKEDYLMMKYKLGADGSKDPVLMQPLNQVFQCWDAGNEKGLLPTNLPGLTWKTLIKYILGVLIIFAGVFALAMVAFSFAKKSTSGDTLKKKASSRSFANPSSAKSSLRGSSKTTTRQARKLASKH